jgi:HPr kinase/phosphorylase
VSTTVHATVVSIADKGVLIRGPSGSGKSDLALRLIDQPGFGLSQDLMRAHLVADDRVHLRVRDGNLLASAPPRLRGLIEIRGVGILRVEPVAETRVALVVDLVEAAGERLPETKYLYTELMGITVPCLRLKAFEASTPSRIRALLNQLPQVREKA